MPQMSQVEGACSAWRHVAERFADVNGVNRVPHGGGGVIVWAGKLWTDNEHNCILSMAI